MYAETVKVKSPVSDENPNGYIVINEVDFVKGEHELFDAPAEPEPAPAPVPPPPVPSAEPAVKQPWQK